MNFAQHFPLFYFLNLFCTDKPPPASSSTALFLINNTVLYYLECTLTLKKTCDPSKISINLILSSITCQQNLTIMM